VDARNFAGIDKNSHSFIEHMTIHSAPAYSTGQVLPFRESIRAMLGLAFVVMLVALDQTVVSTALPTIVAELKGFELYAWVATSYLLTSVITVPIFGRLGDYYGRKPFVVAAIIVFISASLLCAMANSMLFLVIARGLQGIGGGMLIGTAMASIPDLFPDSRIRLRWQVMVSSAFGIANAMGPSLGGFLTESYGWRSLFFINLPVGALSLWFVWRYLPHLRPNQSTERIKLDWLGAGLIALGLGSLQLSVELLPQHGFNLMTVSLLVASVITLALLWAWEKRCSHPILPLDMFDNPRLAPLFQLALLSGFVMFSLLVYAPLLFQGGFGMSPREAGLVITPLVVCITIGSLVNGRIVMRLRSPRIMLYIGFALMAASSLCMAFVTRSTSHNLLLFFMLMGGLGLGFVNPNLMIFSQTMAGRELLGIATAMQQSLRMVGGMLGTALIGTLISYHYKSGVHAALSAAHAQQWTAAFSDPQILVDKGAQTTLLAQMQQAGQDGLALLTQAREALVGSIHLGLAIAAVIAAIALWRVRRVPHIPLVQQSQAVPAE
jgi:EmrB/QacA subfamily drug resistance transporter